MIEGSLGVSGNFTGLAYDHSVDLFCFSISKPLLTLYDFLFFGIHAHPMFYSPAWLLPGNTSWGVLVGYCYHHTGTWQPWQRSETDLQQHYIQRLIHDHPQSCLMQLSTTPRLHSGKSVDRFTSFVLSTLLSLSPFPVDISPTSILFWRWEIFILWSSG